MLGIGLSIWSMLMGGAALLAYAANDITPSLGFDVEEGIYALEGAQQDSLADVLTVSASSNGTLIDSDGYLKWRAHNLITQSGDLSNAAWTKSGATATGSAGLAPDGVSQATRLQDTGAGVVYALYTPVVGQTHTFGIWLKSYDGTDQTVEIFGDSGSWASGDITVTSEWQLFTVSGVASSSTSRSCGVRDQASGDPYDVLAWGGRLIRSELDMQDNPDDATGGVDPQYVPTTTAAVYKRRYDYLPGAKRLLREPQRTNLLTYSTDYTAATAAWTAIGTGTLANNATGPGNKSNSATTLIDSNAGGTGNVYVQQTVTVATSTAYTFSALVKAAGEGWTSLRTSGFTSGDGLSYFNLSTGVVGTKAANHSAIHISDYGNGWYWCSITFTSDVSDTNGNVHVYVSDGDGDATVSLDGTSSILLYTTQFEAGTVPTSPIITKGGTFTRLAETLTVPYQWLPRYQYPVEVTGNLATASDLSWDATSANDSAFIYAVTAGKVYKLDWSGGSFGGVNGVNLRIGVTAVSPSTTFVSTDKTHGSVVFTAQASGNLQVYASGPDATRVGSVTSWRLVEVTRDYLGSTLVTNGTFDTGTTGWTASDATLSQVSGRIRITNSIASAGHGYQDLSGLVEVGKVYEIVATGYAGTGSAHLRVGRSFAATEYASVAPISGITSVVFVAETSTNLFITLRNNNTTAGTYVEFDDIILREVSPLAVSFHMKGEMTYADNGVNASTSDGTGGEMTFMFWNKDTSNYIVTALNTGSTLAGRVYTAQEENNVLDYSQIDGTYMPGSLVEFNIASRHGSNFVQAASLGTAAAENATPVVLMNGSATNLVLAYSGSGPMWIKEFWMWPADIAQEGLVEATNPSLIASYEMFFSESQDSFQDTGITR